MILGFLGGIGGGEMIILLLPLAIVFFLGYYMGLTKGRKETRNKN